MKKKIIGLFVIGLVFAVLAGVAIGGVSYRHEKDNIKYTGNYIFSGTTVEFTGTTVTMSPTWLSLVSGNTILYATNLEFTGTTAIFSGTTFQVSGTTAWLTPTWGFKSGIWTDSSTNSLTGTLTTSGTGTHSGANSFTGGVTSSAGLTVSGGVTNTSTDSVFSGSTVSFSGTSVVFSPTWTRITGTNFTVSSTETHTGTETHSGAATFSGALTTSSTGTHSGENTFSGGVTVTGTAKLNGRVQNDWVAPTWVAGYGFAVSGTTSYKSLFKLDTSLGLGKGSVDAYGEASAKSGATVVLPTITADMDGWELVFVVTSGTTTAWFKPTTGTIQTTSGTTGMTALAPNLTGDSVTLRAAYNSGVSWYCTGSFIQ